MLYIEEGSVLSRKAAFALGDLKTDLKTKGSLTADVAVAVEQRLLRLIHSVSKLVMVSERSDFEVTFRLSSAAN